MPDRDIPVVDVAGPFPGGWVEQEGKPGRIWRGEMLWLTRHGEATVEWSLGRPNAAYGVALAGGGTVERCETFSPVERDFWRRPDPSGVGYVTGVLCIGQHGVTFEDKPMPKKDMDDDGLVAAVMAHPGAVGLFRDDAFASAFNDYLRNEGFRANGDETGMPWSVSFRSIGRIVADIRDIGESYLDFYLGSPEFSREDTARVEAFLDEIGWHRLTPGEVAMDHARALALLETAEAREAGSIPEARRPAIRIQDPDRVWKRTASDRMHAATQSGRTTADEHTAFFDLLDLESDIDPEAENLLRAALEP